MLCAYRNMRECWNWQTGTFEVRVSLTYGFKSRFSHHMNETRFSNIFIEKRVLFYAEALINQAFFELPLYL